MNIIRSMNFVALRYQEVVKLLAQETLALAKHVQKDRASSMNLIRP